MEHYNKKDIIVQELNESDEINTSTKVDNKVSFKSKSIDIQDEKFIFRKKNNEVNNINDIIKSSNNIFNKVNEDNIKSGTKYIDSNKDSKDIIKIKKEGFVDEFNEKYSSMDIRKYINFEKKKDENKNIESANKNIKTNGNTDDIIIDNEDDINDEKMKNKFFSKKNSNNNNNNLINYIDMDIENNLLSIKKVKK